MSFLLTSLKDFFYTYSLVDKYYVAFSGGLDSTVLLHSMREAMLPIHAVYINHHLQKENDDWEAHCKEVCTQWNIPLTIDHAVVEKLPQTSLEECARNARYRLLKSLLSEHSAIVTAHHQDDVAETILLQLLRGAGPFGLAAMPAYKKLTKGIHLRPLLAVSRAELLSYANEHNLYWVEDPSNKLCDYDRNYLRHHVMPKLQLRWPSAQRTLARSAKLQAETMRCLEALAEVDIQPARTTDSTILKVSNLQKLSSERLQNVLRYWINSHDIRVPSRKILQQIMNDIVLKKAIETAPVQTWKEGEIRRFRNQLYLMVPLSEHDPSQILRWKIDQPLSIASLQRTLTTKDLITNAVELPADIHELTVRFRQGGERLKPIGYNQHRSLKNLLNEAGIPPWERARIPLLYCQDQLISVLGYWNSEYTHETANNS